MLGEVLLTKGIIRIVKFGKKPVDIIKEEVEALRLLAESD